MPRSCQTYDLIGKTFGNWSVASRADRAGSKSFWDCTCACGTNRTVQGYLLVTGQSKSCGCVSNRRGQPAGGRPAQYLRWAGILNRCRNKNNPAYKYYGAKGVYVCSRWLSGEDGLNGFQCFVADMGAPPSPTHSIDRWPDNNGPYSPDNCRWATAREQNHNRRSPAVVPAF